MAVDALGNPLRILLRPGQVFDKTDRRRLTNEVYDEPIRYDGPARHNAERLLEELRNHWLIVPRSQGEEDDTETAAQASRDIGPQVDVFVETEPLETPFETGRGFEETQTRYSVGLPQYRIEQGPERFEARAVQVEDEERKALVLADPSEYSFETGL